MKERLQGIITGIVIGSIATCTIGAFAAQYVANDNPFPVTYNGNRVYPQGYNIDGSTYFKLRDIADIVGGFYVDFQYNTIVLTGNNIPTPTPTSSTKELTINDNIGGEFWISSDNLKDNYGNSYTYSISQYWSTSKSDAINGNPYEVILNRQYSKFKGTIYVQNGYSNNNTTQIVIKADDKTIYTSPEMSKTSSPVYFDVNIQGCNDLKIINTNQEGFVNIGDAVFYR